MPILGALGNGGASLFGIGKGVRSKLINTAAIDYLIVAGGGGGGQAAPNAGAGGGGGAGGFRTAVGYAITPGATLTIAVGGGGAGQTIGSNSGFYIGATSLWSTGGGRGGSDEVPVFAGGAGGSGGGVRLLTEWITSL